MLQSIGKQFAKKLFKKIIRALLIKTAPIWGSVLAIFALAILCYLLIFELPKQAILGLFDGHDRASAYEYGRSDPMKEIFERYRSVAERWDEGLTEEQLMQVEPYALDWAWLAAVDRTLGDPKQSGVRDVKELALDPEATFDLVRPVFEWVEKEKEIVQESCIEIEGKETTRHIIHTSTTYEPQMLLNQAQTMQGVFVYSYRTETHSTFSKSPCGQLTTTETYYVLSGITAEISNWEPLRSILREHGIEDKDHQFLLDYWHSFLSDPDGREHNPLPDNWKPIEGDLKWPAAEGRITSQFGMRTHPIKGEYKLHSGIDIAAPQGTDVYAAADGTVIYSGVLGTAGLAIILDHGDLETRYYHLSKAIVGKGETVNRGEVIGQIGSTGDSTGPHLHFETRVGGEPVDPLSFYQ